jgi:hypothetical protein
MQTERVTFLTTPDHKAALDAFAAGSGRSVGHVVREATSRYISEGEADDEEALAMLLREVEALLPKWNAQMDRMEANLDRAHNAVRDALAKVDGGYGEHL